MVTNPEIDKRPKDEIAEDLLNLKDYIIGKATVIDKDKLESDNGVFSELNKFSDIVSPDLMKSFGISQIPEKVLIDFILKFKSFYNGEKFLDGDWENVDFDFVGNIFGELQKETKEVIKTNLDLAFLFYIKQLCPNNFEEIFVQFETMYNGLGEEYYSIAALNNPNTCYDVIKVIEKFKDESLKYFKFCSGYDGTYIKKNISSLGIDDKGVNYFEKYASTMNFWEIFVEEEESANLFEYLSLNPLKLTNLGGRVIKEIDLDVNKGVNFCFRGILEMVKSRPDIEFPHLSGGLTEAEKRIWETRWKEIIKEYELLLRNYISKDFTVDENGERIQKPKSETFDKIFYTRPYGDEVVDNFHTNENTLGELTQNEISEYSFKINSEQGEEYYEKTGAENEEAEQVSKNLFSHIESYVKDHPNEKILVCIDQHGWLDGSSRNGWKKEDWIKLANISPNLKIWSIRCFFGEAFDSENIYNHQSSISGFSNKTVTTGYITNIINDANEKGLGFHEMEIYARLNYSFSATPLSESMEYINRNTGEAEMGKVGLAQNDEGKINDFNELA